MTSLSFSYSSQTHSGNFFDPPFFPETFSCREKKPTGKSSSEVPLFFKSNLGSLSFFSQQFHPDFISQPTKSPFYRWASAMTASARKFHLFSKKEILNLESPSLNLEEKKTLRKISNLEIELFSKIQRDLSVAVSENFNLLYKTDSSSLQFFENPLLCIHPLSKLTVSFEDSIQFKFHLKQLGVNKGKFLDLLYLPSAPCQISLESPFKVKIALIMENIYNALKEDKLLFKKIQSGKSLSSQIAKNKTIDDILSKCPAMNPNTLQTIFDHLETAIQNWDLYCYQILTQSIFILPPRIQELDIRTLKESFLFKQKDLKLLDNPLQRKALEILEHIYNQFLSDPEVRGNLQLLFFQLETKEPDPHFLLWMENKTPLPLELSHTSLSEIDNYLENERDICPDIRAKILKMLLQSLKNWDVFVADTLNIEQMSLA
ncbi:MAG: hypothetical protein FJZ62_03715 [Chlamydiae bacterium]|nr:hypothetical protein [Chlamydiota bacterium]